MFVSFKNNKAYTLVEIILTIAIGAVVITAVTFGVFNFRNNVQYDILLNQIVESVNYTQIKATSFQLDVSGVRSNYGVKFFENKFVEFEGTTFIEGADSNIEINVPIGLRLSSDCSPNQNGEVVFSKGLGENSNMCTVSIYRWEQSEPTGDIVIGKYGVEQGW